MSDFTNEQIQRLGRKRQYMQYLSDYRRQVIHYFQQVVEVSVNVQRETQTPTVNFTNDIIKDLPPRVKALLLTDFASWLKKYGRELANSSEPFDIDVELDITLCGFVENFSEFSTRPDSVNTDRLDVVVSDRITQYRVVHTFAAADFAPFLQAGLDWHPSARSFFIPRS